MQTLFFENAWEKTISTQDRINIQRVFDETNFESGVTIEYLWEAKNHLNAVLATTLIHNHTENPITLENINIQYKSMRETFTVPTTIPAYHSMPWTFIFDYDGIDGRMDYVITAKV